ncbi:hypothetical protein [Schlesneria sp. T3-172]|uniref:hypothetical protein n=1 Tax=Schlesneria sphaerica TaxID=3373610 RepID=UPI0037C61CE8
MNRLQLATLLSWAGETGLQGRKRLQKVVYFLQAAGCPLECVYTLHHFGPYSCDVADACDEIVAAGLVDETGGPRFGSQYVYQLKPITRQFLEQTIDEGMQRFEQLGKELIGSDLWQLELGSTILFYFSQSTDQDWDQALQLACQFKGVAPEFPASQNALKLAKRFHAVDAT